VNKIDIPHPHGTYILEERDRLITKKNKKTKHVLSISSVSFRSIVKKCVHVSDDNVINTVEKNKEEIDARTEEVGVTSLPIKPFGD